MRGTKARKPEGTKRCHGWLVHQRLGRPCLQNHQPSHASSQNRQKAQESRKGRNPRKSQTDYLTSVPTFLPFLPSLFLLFLVSWLHHSPSQPIFASFAFFAPSRSPATLRHVVPPTQVPLRPRQPHQHQQHPGQVKQLLLPAHQRPLPALAHDRLHQLIQIINLKVTPAR